MCVCRWSPDSVVAVVHGGSASTSSVDVVSCADNDCKIVSTFSAAELPLGAINDAVAYWPSGEAVGVGSVPELWIGCDAGLVHMSVSGQFTLLLDATNSAVSGGIDAVAVSKSLPMVVAGNTYHLW